MEEILSDYDGQFEAVKALAGTLFENKTNEVAKCHPHPFLNYFKELQKSSLALDQSLKSLQLKYSETAQKLQATSKELETQVSVLDATTSDKHRLLQQFQDLSKNRDTILVDLNKAQKELSESQTREESLRKKLQRIVNVYASQVEKDPRLL